MAELKNQRARRPSDATEIHRSVTIRRSAADLYSFWRDLHNLEGCLPAGARVRMKSKRISHWSVRAPGGHEIEWDAAIVEDERDSVIAWRSRPDADVENSGSVRFEPAGDDADATKVTLAVRYALGGGILGKTLGRAARGRAEREVAAGLRRVKQRLEKRA